jgi:aminoglycoside phosphotransferase (APT) family kinase protein
MLRAPEAGEVSAAVRGWLTSQGYGAVTDGAPPERLTGGADFWVYGLRFAGPGLPGQWSAPLVARVPAGAGRYDRLRRASAVQSWAAARGYPAPQVLRVLAPGEALPSPVQVMARAPGVPLIAAAGGKPWGIPELMVRLGVAQAELHRLGSPPPDADPGESRDNWLWLARRLAESGDAGELAGALRTIEPVLDRLQVRDPVVCHGDFHPLNVLATPGEVALHVIDWTNVAVGDRHGDISWTLLWFEIATVVGPRPADRVLMRALRRTLARAYLTGYRRVLPVDRERVRLWRPVSLLAIWSAAEASQRAFFGEEPRLPARLIGWAAREFHRAGGVASAGYKA